MKIRDLEKMSLAEQRDIVYDSILEMIGELEKYKESPERKFKTEKDFRVVCNEGNRLLDKLGERYVTNGDLNNNSPEFKRYIHSLKTLNIEVDQEQIDKELVRMAYRTVRKYTPKILEELTKYYLLCGPEGNEK